MKEKFLPIGSICKIANSSEKLMILGYFGQQKYDYTGCIYPSGVVGDNFYYFNHSEIVSIDYLGYTDNDFEDLNNKLLERTRLIENEQKRREEFIKNIKFDENGVVIFDDIGIYMN